MQPCAGSLLKSMIGSWLHEFRSAYLSAHLCGTMDKNVVYLPALLVQGNNGPLLVRRRPYCCLADVSFLEQHWEASLGIGTMRDMAGSKLQVHQWLKNR